MTPHVIDSHREFMITPHQLCHWQKHLPYFPSMMTKNYHHAPNECNLHSAGKIFKTSQVETKHFDREKTKTNRANCNSVTPKGSTMQVLRLSYDYKEITFSYFRYNLFRERIFVFNRTKCNHTVPKGIVGYIL